MGGAREPWAATDKIEALREEAQHLAREKAKAVAEENFDRAALLKKRQQEIEAIINAAQTAVEVETPPADTAALLLPTQNSQDSGVRPIDGGRGLGAASNLGVPEQADAVGDSRANLKTIVEGNQWQTMPMRELRKLGVLHGIDLAGCYNKSDIVDRLREGMTSSFIPNDTSSLHSQADCSGESANQTIPQQPDHHVADVPLASSHTSSVTSDNWQTMSM